MKNLQSKIRDAEFDVMIAHLDVILHGLVGEGEIVGHNSYSITIRTYVSPTSADHPDTLNNGGITQWNRSSLELIEDAPIFGVVKENISTCPKCSKASCIGLDRIECLIN